MKRSEINKIIDYTIDKAEFFKIPLPPFAFYTLEDWKKVTADEAEIVDNMLGWDITDFGTSVIRTLEIKVSRIKDTE